MPASRTLETNSGSEDIEMEMALQLFRDRLQGEGSSPRRCTIDAPVASPDQTTMQASRTLESDSGSENLEMESALQSCRDRLHGG